MWCGSKAAPAGYGGGGGGYGGGVDPGFGKPINVVGPGGTEDPAFSRPTVGPGGIDPGYGRPPVFPGIDPGFNRPPIDDDCEDCVELRTTYKTVEVPCTRNVTKHYTVKIPKTVTKQVPCKVPFTDMENRYKTVPVTVMKPETRWKTEQECYKYPVQKKDTVMVPVTKKEPRTVWVDVTKTEPRIVTKTVMEDRWRTKKTPYTIQVPETRYKTECEQVPVTKWKTEMKTKMDTIYIDEVKTVCTPVTKMVRKKIPVVTAMPKQPGACPGEYPGYSDPQAIVDKQYMTDLNKDGVVTAREEVIQGFKDGKTMGQSLAGFARKDRNHDGVVTTGEALA